MERQQQSIKTSGRWVFFVLCVGALFWSSQVKAKSKTKPGNTSKIKRGNIPKRSVNPPAYKFGVVYQYEEGCSRSFASSGFQATFWLRVEKKKATLVLKGNHSAASGAHREPAMITSSSFSANWTGKAKRQGNEMVLRLRLIRKRCKTKRGYYYIAKGLCQDLQAIELRCQTKVLPVYPKSSSLLKQGTPQQVAFWGCKLMGAVQGFLQKSAFQRMFVFQKQSPVRHVNEEGRWAAFQGSFLQSLQK